MPGYGITDSREGLLPWSFATERLETSHDYWVATVWPDGRPHVTPVWGAWFDDHLWFSADQTSRKARNLAAEPRCTVTTDNALEPVILDGVAELVTDRSDVARFTEASRAKYAAEWVEDLYTVDFFDANLGGGGTYRVTPTTVFALAADAFTTSPTRWTF
jgi:PPOX class probable F420-dependent enzyme